MALRSKNKIQFLFNFQSNFVLSLLVNGWFWSFSLKSLGLSEVLMFSLLSVLVFSAERVNHLLQLHSCPDQWRSLHGSSQHSSLLSVTLQLPWKLKLVALLQLVIDTQRFALKTMQQQQHGFACEERTDIFPFPDCPHCLTDSLPFTFFPINTAQSETTVVMLANMLLSRSQSDNTSSEGNWAKWPQTVSWETQLEVGVNKA